MSTVEQDMQKNSEMLREFEEGNYVSTLNVSRPFFQECNQACSNWCWATGAVMASSAFTSVDCKADEAAVASREFHAQCVPGSGMMCNFQCNRAGQMENISGGSGGSYTGHDPEGYPINANYAGLLTYRAPYGGVGRWKECVRPSGFEISDVSSAPVQESSLPNGLQLDMSTVEQDMQKNSEMLREFEEGNYVSTLNVSRPFFQECNQACSNWCWATGAV